MRVGFIGGVNSSLVTLSKLIQHDLNVVAVFGYKPSQNMIVSGYNDLECFSNENMLNFIPFTRINDHIKDVKSLDLDVLFIVGISQLVCEEIVQSPKLGCIGFHPTLLPRGRGRAPIAWLVHEGENGAANFFLINNVADSGPIFVQEHFYVDESDTAKSVEDKLLNAAEIALDRWLPKFKKGEWNPMPQSEYFATEYGVRKPEDGLIEWHKSASEISRLIRAASNPHPGAYTFFNMEKVIVENCSIENDLRIKGCVGRVLKEKGSCILIQTGDGLIWLHEIKTKLNIKVGDRLGFQVEQEIFEIKKDLQNIKSMFPGVSRK